MQLRQSETKRKKFQVNQVDLFTFREQPWLWKLSKLRVWHDNDGPSPAWFLSSIYVLDELSGRLFCFVIDSWLSKEHGAVLKELPVSAMGLSKESSRRLWPFHGTGLLPFPWNIRKLLFFYVFRCYRKRPMTWNMLTSTLQFFVLMKVILAILWWQWSLWQIVVCWILLFFRLNIHKMRSCNICVECKNILKRNLKISQAPFNHQ